MKTRIKEQVKKWLLRLMRKLPLSKRVLFFGYYGEQYSGSPKYISRYMSDNGFDNRVIWAFTQPEKHTEYGGKAIKYGGLRFCYYLSTSKVIVTNYRMTQEFIKRKGQTYIQTWHSSLRLKMIEKDAEETLPPHYLAMAKQDSPQIDYLLAGSQKSREIFERAFWYDGQIVNCGTPQCDILFEERMPLLEKVQAHYGLPAGSRIALYAPTFRKNGDMSVYQLPFAEIADALGKKFGGQWYVLARLHPHLSARTDCIRYSDRVLQATDYDDVQELLCASDVLISDYSAIMFDFGVTRRPCFLYAPDLLDYTTKDRNLYFDIKKLPYPCAETAQDLLKSIETFCPEVYAQQAEAFLREIGSYDDGNAGKRVFELIREAIT